MKLNHLQDMAYLEICRKVAHYLASWFMLQHGLQNVVLFDDTVREVLTAKYKDRDYRTCVGAYESCSKTIYIRLRRTNGHLYTWKYLLETICHELAHIESHKHNKRFYSLYKSILAFARKHL